MLKIALTTIQQKKRVVDMKHALSRPFQSISTINPDQFRLLLTSCNDLNSLLKIHCHLIVSGTNLDNFTTTHLINSYSSFKKCQLSRSVFDSVQNPGVVLWNSIIRAYTRSNRHEKALEMYGFMLENNVESDKYTFTFLLKACTGVMDVDFGRFIHGEISRKGLECDVFIGTGLIDMYCKMGDLGVAKKLFDKIPVKDVAVWNAMIAGFSQSEQLCEALDCFRGMQFSGLEPNSVSLLNLFPAICKLMDIELCKCIHGYVSRRGFHFVVSNGLIDMYSKCGRVDIARRMFDLMWVKDDVSWGTMMAGYSHNGCFFDVLDLFDDMKTKNVKINKVSAVSAFLAAAEMRDLEKGKEVHSCAIKQKIDSDTVVATSLITMYVKCRELKKARELFELLEGKDIVAWSAIIAAFVQSGFAEEALSLFREMQNKYLKPNKITLMSVLPACGELSCLRLGKSVHCNIIKANIDSVISIETAMVSMYAKCGSFTQAQIIFNNLMPCNEIVCWNALINGYAQIGEPYRSLEMFCKLKLFGLEPDAGTIVGVLSASALIGNMAQGRCIHGQVVKSGFESDSHVKNSLIDMYSKCGSLSCAEYLFSKTNFAKDEVSWNILIAGYMRNRLAKEAISAFQQMKKNNIRPNLVTFVTILPAAALLATLREGMTFHACIIHIGLYSNTLIGNSLVDMYAKCGRLDFSEMIFNEMDNKDTVSWNAMLAAYGMHGHGENALIFFSRMHQSHVQVDSVSFVSILSACRHAGLVEEGRQIFYSMREKHCLEPSLEHYACVVDLLGRAGLFDEVMDLIKTMKVEPDAAVWGALLGACRMHSNISIAEVAVDHLVKLEPGNSTHYVVLSGIYARSGRWDDARNTRLKMEEAGLKKIPAGSWV